MRLVIRKQLNKRLRKARTGAKVSGTSERPRLSVFRSSHYMYAQLIDDTKGKTVASASTRPLHKGKAKLAKSVAAKQVGALIAEAAKKLGITSAVFHRGMHRYHGRVKAVAEGAREGGLQI